MKDYKLMCKTSPAQKEWKPKVGNVTSEGVIIDLPQNPTFRISYGNKASMKTRREEGNVLIEFVDILGNAKPFWLPTQEDWQDIYWNKTHSPVFDHTEVQRILGEHIDYLPLEIENKLSYIGTLLWCLFVHKEVYGLTWDWEESKWVKE
jgi:hypothetical protein